MNFFTSVQKKWDALREKTRPFRESVAEGTRDTCKTMKVIWSYIYRMRAVFLTIPVAIGAVYLAILNSTKLPQSVGIGLQSDGSFSMLVPRELAVFAPLAVTALCVLLMLCSKKTAYPWLISMFTLTLPLLIYFTNAFPA